MKAIGAVAASAPLCTAAIGQDAASFPLPSGDPNDPEVELFSAYEIDQSSGYTKIIMDHVRPGVPESGTLDVAAIRLSLDIEARRYGLPEPIIIAAYAYDGPAGTYTRTARESTGQDVLFDKLLSNLASISQRPIVYIRVTAFGADLANEMSSLHVGALLADLEKNRLGPDFSRAPTGSEVVLPYFTMHLEGNNIYDAAVGSFGDTPLHEIQRGLAVNIINTVSEENKRLTGEY